MKEEELRINQPEIGLLREMRIYYPPISLNIYAVDPIANPEALFLYLVLSRSELEPDKDIFVGTFQYDFQGIISSSVIPTPLTSRFRFIINESPNIHFRTYEATEELLRAVDLYYRSSNHLYLFIPHLRENELEFLEKLAALLKKIKTTGRRSATVNIFIDIALMEKKEARLLKYYSDAIYVLRVNEKTRGRELALIKLSFSNPPSSPLEMLIDSDSVKFQIVRSF
ncbi:MAG: hypothetical protein QW039_05165 [Fervidicoccaceae archaeon]